MKYSFIRKGFTLIELLIVIAIISILAAVLVPNLQEARKKGQIAAFQGEMDTFRKLAENFYSNQSSYAGLFTTMDADPAVDDIVDPAVQSVVTSLKTRASDGEIYGSNLGYEYAIYGRIPGSLETSVSAADIWCVDSNNFAGNVNVDATTQFDSGSGVSQCW